MKKPIFQLKWTAISSSNTEEITFAGYTKADGTHVAATTANVILLDGGNAVRAIGKGPKSLVYLEQVSVSEEKKEE